MVLCGSKEMEIFSEFCRDTFICRTQSIHCGNVKVSRRITFSPKRGYFFINSWLKLVEGLKRLKRNGMLGIILASVAIEINLLN